MSPAEFEPAVPASVRPQTGALDRAATGSSRLSVAKEKLGRVLIPALTP